MAIDQTDWTGAVHDRESTADLIVEVPLQPSPQGGSGTFLASLSDGERWWVKPLNNPQSPRVPTNELVVGRGGITISAPVCEVVLAEIPQDIVGWAFRPGCVLEVGLACASKHVVNAQEIRNLEY